MRLKIDTRAAPKDQHTTLEAYQDQEQHLLGTGGQFGRVRDYLQRHSICQYRPRTRMLR